MKEKKMKAYVEKFRKGRTLRRKAIALVTALSIVVAGGVFGGRPLPGAWATAEPEQSTATFCGMEEHVHVEACAGELVLNCEIEEAEAHSHTDECYLSRTCGDDTHEHVAKCYTKGADPLCEKLETEGHTHGEACMKQTAVCELQEHTHVDACYVDPNSEPKVETGTETGEEPGETDGGSDENTDQGTDQPPVDEEPVIELELSELTGAAQVYAGETASWSFSATAAEKLSYSIANEAGETVASAELALDSTSIAWESTAVGNYTLTLTACKGEESKTVQAALAVVAQPAALAATVSTEQRYCVAGAAVSFNVNIEGGVAGYAIDATATQGDTVLNLAVAENVITVQTVESAAASTIQLNVTVTDAAGTACTAEASLPCSSNVKGQSAWRTALANLTLGDDWALNLVNAANSQIGYGENENYFNIDGNGNKSYYTPYGGYYGLDCENNWSILFGNILLTFAHVPKEHFPADITWSSWLNALEEEKLFAEAGAYVPQLGDVVFLNGELVGVVVATEGGYIEAVVGDVNGKVSLERYSPSDSAILGYGMVSAAQEASKGGQETEPTPDVTPEVTPTVTPEPTPDVAPEATPTAEPTMEVPEDKPVALPVGTVVVVSGKLYPDADYNAYRPVTPEFIMGVAGQSGSELKVEITEALQDANGAQWYKVKGATDNNLVNIEVAFVPYIPAESIKAGSAVLPEVEPTPTVPPVYVETTLKPSEGSSADVQVAGMLPEGAVLTVEKVGGRALDNARLDLMETLGVDYVGDWLFAFDLDIGAVSKLESGSTATVTIGDLDLGYSDYSNLKATVYHELAEGGIETLPATIDENGVTFSTNSFSMFYPSIEVIGSKEAVFGTDAEHSNGRSSILPQLPIPAATPKRAATAALSAPTGTSEGATPDPSDEQIKKEGGTKSNDNGTVRISKTIDGTELENVFDITLKVETTQKMQEFTSETDVAAVIVMDVSNTMNDNFTGTSDQRYKAAIEAAEAFIDKFAGNGSGVSRIGMVAFNTNAMEIFPLSSCENDAEATALKNRMRTQTGNIVAAGDYNKSHSRFTNMEAGLKRANDMLAKADNQSKFVIFLTDGFPTTYVKSGYSGYDPYMDSTGDYNGDRTPGTDGYFYDSVTKKTCWYGTSYSDKAAERAENQALAMRNSGITIFSIGVDVGAQTIDGYEVSDEKRHLVIERSKSTYRLGSSSSSQSFKDWLGNKIGSDKYLDSNNKNQLINAFDEIFADMKEIWEKNAEAKWITSDPLPTGVEFVNFYDKGSYLVDSLSGTSTPGGENMATVQPTNDPDHPTKINWDLKESGYTEKKEGNTTTYTYELSYRVRLKNEARGFHAKENVATNGTTTLTYHIFEKKNDETIQSHVGTLDYHIPEVEGYLAEFHFRKLDERNESVEDAVFTLYHDDKNCAKCNGKEGIVPGLTYRASPDDTGVVTFNRIPSGHKYILTETIPDGYKPDFNGYKEYKVTVAYDKLTIAGVKADGTEESITPGENWIIYNYIGAEMPGTGGIGNLPFVLAGLLMMSAPMVYIFAQKRRREQN